MRRCECRSPLIRRSARRRYSRRSAHDGYAAIQQIADRDAAQSNLPPPAATSFGMAARSPLRRRDVDVGIVSVAAGLPIAAAIFPHSPQAQVPRMATYLIRA